MDRYLVSIKKRVLVPLVAVLAVAVWLVLCHAHYSSYWYGTIQRVQTTDFNLLHHTLPTVLSQLIVAGRDDVIQEVLDSTYGLFGLVVTNPSGTAVLYRTSKVYHRQSWQHLATPEGLSKLDEPYDLLTNPPPLAAAYGHASPRKTGASRLREPPGGRVLGRVYYVRAVPPPFVEDMSGFLGPGSLELSGARRGYFYITLSTTGFSLAFLFFVLWRKRELELKRRELEHIERELEIRQKALEHLSAELLSQQARKRWLEQEAERVYGHAAALKQALESLREQLAVDQGSLKPPAQARPARPASSLLEEIAALIPGLADNAQLLRTQAEELKAHCLALEQRQEEMRKIIEQAYARGSLPLGNVLPFAPSRGGAHPPA